MTIVSADIKILESKSMLDVPEGGGGPTGNEVPDGVSNAVFPDISELDRTVGRVNLRQLHLAVLSADQETFMGANMVVSRPPDDPNVSITLFKTGESFDKRVDAVSRLESYLFKGSQYPGDLFNNHIAGMMSVTVFQRSDVVPAIGETIVLTKREGFSDEVTQYVRIEEISVVATDFEDAQGVYTRNVVTFQITDPLRYDFPGFDITRYEITKSQRAAATGVANTVVADAAQYAGVVPLAQEASLGDFTVKGTSIYTQLVPSAQVETPLADLRTNQLSASVVATGSPLVQTLNGIFTTTQTLSIGGGFVPGTLSLVRSGITLTDQGGRLYNAADQVGTVDYANGILLLTTNVFGTGSGSHVVTYTPGEAPVQVPMTQGFEVTVSNRSLNYVRTISPPPVKGSVAIDYRVQDRWYTLQDDGSGALRGTDSAYGAGMVNYTTGTVSLTLGYLPDVDSSLIWRWTPPETEKTNSLLALDNDGDFYFPMNTDGDATLNPGSKAIAPGALTLTWTYSGSKTATDDGEGNLTGDARGTVNYSDGTVRFSPNLLPPPGTQINLSVAQGKTKTTASTSLADAGSVMTLTFGVANITPGTVWITLQGVLKYTKTGFAQADWGGPRNLVLADLFADGDLYLLDREGSLLVGEIDYASGTGTVNKSLTVPDSNARNMVLFDNIYKSITVPVLGMRGA